MTYAIIIITLVVLCGLCGWLLFSAIRRNKSNKSSGLNTALITLLIIVLVGLLIVLAAAVAVAVEGPDDHSDCDHADCHPGTSVGSHAYVDTAETQQYI